MSATVLIGARFLPVLRNHFGRHCEVLGEEDDGRVRVRLAAHMARSIAEQVAGWGDAVEVVEPEAVRDALARIGAELVARYENSELSEAGVSIQGRAVRVEGERGR